MAEGKSIGIDLGTTNTVMFQMHTTPEIILNHESDQLTPSVVALKRSKKTGDTLLVGKRAQDQAIFAGKNYLHSIKRLMGRGYNDVEVQKMKENVEFEILPSPHGDEDVVRVKLGEKLYEPKDISSEILKKMKNDAEYRLNNKVEWAVITVPAYFSERQKHATREAGLLAGLRVKRVIDEPSAAAIAYGIDQNDGEDRMVLVFDLGGGTFDVSILLMVGGTFQQMANEGDMWLGGDDFDELIMDWVIKQIEDEEEIDGLRQNHEFMKDLRKKSSDAKVMLSSSQSADIIINTLKDESGMPVPIEYEITRSEFNQLIEPGVKKSIEVVDKALKTAELERDDIDAVLMVGGSSIIPLFQQRVEAEFGKEKVMRNIDPMTCVAQGAAILAKNLSDKAVWCACGEENSFDDLKCKRCGFDLTVTIQEKEEQQESAGGAIEHIGGITAKPYGIEVSGDRFIELIPKGSEYPTSEPYTDRFKIAFLGQQIIKIPLKEGFSEKASDNELMGNIWFTGLPPGLPEGTEIEISLALDGDMIATVDCRIRSMDWSKRMTLQHGGWVNRDLDEAMELHNELIGDDLSGRDADEVEQKINALQKAVDQDDQAEADRQLEELRAIKNRNQGSFDTPPDPDSWRKPLENQLALVETNYGYVSQYLDQDDPGVAALIKWMDDAKIALRDDDTITGNELNDAGQEAFNKVPIVRDLIFGLIFAGHDQVDPIVQTRLSQARTELIACIRDNDNNRIKGAFENFHEQLAAAIKCLGDGPVIPTIRDYTLNK